MIKKKSSSQLLAYIREGKEMTRGEKLRLIVSLSIPSILSQLSSILMFFIDASMVGSLGARASASIGLVESTTWLFGGLLSSASMGFSVQVAHAIGAGDFERARRVLRQAIVCALIFSGVLMCAGIAVHSYLPFWLGGGADIARDSSLYFLIFACALPFLQMHSLAGSMLKCSGNMKIPSVLNVLMCVMDVAFNYLFIFMAGLGVAGAALGTFCAIFTASALMNWFLVFRSKELSLRRYRGSFRPKADCVMTAVKIGAPMGLQQIFMGGAQIFVTAIVAPLGNIAISANTFAITVESICYMPGYGIAEAATTLVGQGIGAGKRLLTVSFARMSVALGMVVMTLMAVLMFVFAPELMSVMTPVDEIRSLGALVLRIEAFAEPMFAAAIVCYGVFVGAGDTLRPAVMNLCTMWGIRLSLSFVLAPVYGLKGVWTAMAVELTLRGVIFLVRLFSGSWSNKMQVKEAAA